MRYAWGMNTKASQMIKVISYWPDSALLGVGASHVRHTSIEHNGYIANAQIGYPSACVWIIPGTEEEQLEKAK